MVADVEELLQVLVNGAVLQQCLWLSCLLPPASRSPRCAGGTPASACVAVFQSEKGVLHLLRRDEVVTLHDF